jgi:hypothetical protein
MFTGIVQAVGRIEALHPHRVATGRLPLAGVRIGDSICVQGCCLTVIRKAQGRLWFRVEPHSAHPQGDHARAARARREGQTWKWISWCATWSGLKPVPDPRYHSRLLGIPGEVDAGALLRRAQ